MLGRIKRIIRTSRSPLSQVARRISEGFFNGSSNEKNITRNEYIYIKDWIIMPGDAKNACVLTKRGSVGIVTHKKGTLIGIEIFSLKVAALTYPLDSSILYIYIYIYIWWTVDERKKKF